MFQVPQLNRAHRTTSEVKCEYRHTAWRSDSLKGTSTCSHSRKLSLGTPTKDVRTWVRLQALPVGLWMNSNGVASRVRLLAQDNTKTAPKATWEILESGVCT